ncbi:MAG: arylsulfatase [bacterium]|nr:arylsulfatase [bacterium]
MNSPNRREFFKIMGLGTASVIFPIGSGCSPKTNQRPNILLLMTDQHRFDCIGAAGNKIINTPNYDRIANDGVTFTSAYSSTPTCTPARSALLTGKSPWNHGMLGYGRVSQNYDIKMPRALRDSGYYTMGIGKMHWHPQKTLNGFHATLIDESGRVESDDFISDYRRWFKKQAPELDPDATGIGWNEFKSGVYALPEELHPTFWTGKTAADFIESYNREDPFFLKVSFARPHSPYDPPRRFMDMYDQDKMPEPITGSWADKYKVHKTPPNPNLWHGDLGIDQAKRSRQGYYGSVSFLDEQIGRILSALDRKGLYENTLILTISDHGDMLGDHHLWRKSYAYEGSAHIPMLLKPPVSVDTEIKNGSSLSYPVEIRDALPTFLDCAGSLIPESIDGKSLLDLLRDKNADWREFIDLEHSVCYSDSNHWNALTDGKFKYIFHAKDGSEQLFDLVNDPGESGDLSKDGGYNAALTEWRSRMVEHLSERGDDFVSGGELVYPRKNLLYSPSYPG